MSEEEEEEDWFERALREAGEEAFDDGATAEEDADATTEEDAGVAASTDEPTGEAGDPFADDDDDAEPFGDDEDVFGDDFATALQNAPSPGGEADAFAGPDTGGFEDEAFESDIPRIDLGIEGLDEMIQGGIPERSLMVAIGEAGTGKSTFGLQFVHHALQQGESAVFIALEESRAAVIDTAEERGWEFSTYIENDQLALLDLDPIEMANSLTSIRSELPALVREFGADRLVLDSVSLLEMMYDEQAVRRTQIYDFTQSLKEAGVTTMLTSEASEGDPYHSRFGIIEYLTDGVFVLRYIRPEDFRETRLAVEIQKLRNANHSREMKPFDITGEGIEVYRQASIF